jgi:hypothetical protein
VTSTAARDVRSALLVAAASVVVGALVGLVWRWVAPLSAFQKEGGAGIPVGGAETAVAADGWFAVLSGLAGILVAVGVVLLVRQGRLGSLAGLVAGGLLGAVVAWRTGLLLSPPTVTESLAAVPAGERFDGPLRISAIGVLMAWPTTAVITFFAIVAGLEVDHDESRVEPGQVAHHPAGTDDGTDDGTDRAVGADGTVSPDGRWAPPAPR